jgi:predicted nucleotidyltransferase
MKTPPLEPDQQRALERAIAEERARRRHLVVALSGSHAYGFPSPDSDLDLKAVHVEPTSSLLALKPPKPSASRLERVDGVEIDYTSNELAGFLAGLVAGNGNYLERALGPYLYDRAPELEPLAALARGTISKRCYHHYRGFATGQRNDMMGDRTPVTAKRVLYALRTSLTGARLLATGELATDLAELAPREGFGDALELIAMKREGEKAPLVAASLDRWRRRVDEALARLDAALAGSALPDEAPNQPALEAFLLEVRRACWSTPTELGGSQRPVVRCGNTPVRRSKPAPSAGAGLPRAPVCRASVRSRSRRGSPASGRGFEGRFKGRWLPPTSVGGSPRRPAAAR